MRSRGHGIVVVRAPCSCARSRSCSRSRRACRRRGDRRDRPCPAPARPARRRAPPRPRRRRRSGMPNGSSVARVSTRPVDAVRLVGVEERVELGEDQPPVAVPQQAAPGQPRGLRRRAHLLGDLAQAGVVGRRAMAGPRRARPRTSSTNTIEDLVHEAAASIGASCMMSSGRSTGSTCSTVCTKYACGHDAHVCNRVGDVTRSAAAGLIAASRSRSCPRLPSNRVNARPPRAPRRARGPARPQVATRPTSPPPPRRAPRARAGWPGTRHG